MPNWVTNFIELEGDEKRIAEMKESGLAELQNHTYDLHGNTKARIGCTQGSSESDDAYVKTLTEDVQRL